MNECGDEIWGSHGGEDVDCVILDCDAVKSCRCCQHFGETASQSRRPQSTMWWWFEFRKNRKTVQLTAALSSFLCQFSLARVVPTTITVRRIDFQWKRTRCGEGSVLPADGCVAAWVYATSRMYCIYMHIPESARRKFRFIFHTVHL
jgi:hypothetical protein